MSLLAPDSVDGLGDDPGICIIKDVQYQFLPNLAAVYGDTCAIMIQQFWFASRNPFFKGEPLDVKRHEGLTFMKMWPFMWYDTIDGITKHLSRSTWYRYMGALKSCEAMRVESSLGERNLHSSRRNEEHVPSWYALNSPLVRLHTSAYQKAFDESNAQRAMQRETLFREEKGAYWRPAPGEDTSKPLDNWRQLFVENWPKEAMPKARRHGGRRVKLLESQLEIESVSEIVESQNIENGAVNAYESQLEIGPISHPLQSQVEIEQSQLETLVLSQVETEAQSQLETLNDVKLRNAPYIDKTSEAETSFEEATTIDTPLAMSPADAGVAVENQDFLSEPIPKLQQLSPTAAQMGLPGIMATLLPEPNGAAVDLARRFQIAAEAQDIDCSDEIAARVVARFPIATLDASSVKQLIGRDRTKIGLDSYIGGDERATLLANVDDLRWQIFIWPGFKPEIEAYYARKKTKPKLSGSFITKFTEEKPPEREWVMSLINDAKYAMRGEGQALKQARADAAWDALDAAQRRAFDDELFRRVRELPGSVDANRVRLRLQLLNDDDFVAGLSQIEVATESRLDPVFEARQMAREVENRSASYQPTPGEAQKMAMHAAQLARNIRSGKYDLDGAEDDVIGRLFYGPAAAVYLRGLVEEQLTLEERAA